MINENGTIEVTGARVHNLKNVSVSIPRRSLTVITGLSGSGKSSLAFDTIFAEGQRRYIDTFSSYARGYIGTMQRPDVDRITGLSPVISIDQKTTSRNPRSTVGTATEINDFLRLLYARAATAYSYVTGQPMSKFTDEQIIELICREYEGQRVLLLAPVVRGRKGHYRELFDSTRRKGFFQVRVDGELREITQGMKLDRYVNHDIEVVIDKLKIHSSEAESDDETAEFLHRLRRSVDKAMQVGSGLIMVVGEGRTANGSEGREANDVRFFSRNLMDPESGLSYSEPAPHSFSFNTPQGWCPCCKGLGKVKVNGDRLSVNGSVSGEELDSIVHDDEDWYSRLVAFTQRAEETDEDEEKTDEAYEVCPECHGLRLNKEALSYRFGGKSIAELCAMDLSELVHFFEELQKNDYATLSETQSRVAEPLLKEIMTRLRFMLSVGLDYLSLSRSSDSLSGGESQRLRLATQIGSRLVNVLYILDEPSIGLHQRDNERLIQSLRQLRDLGNSVIVVEHDEQIMRQADYIIDIGPKAGRLGGEIVFQGTPEELVKADTLTGKYLRGEVKGEGDPKNLQIFRGSPGEESIVERRESKVESGAVLTLRGCTGNNLKNVDVAFPLGRMIAVTGVSGSGKSTLINQTLYPILSQKFYRSLTKPLPYESIEGVEMIDKVIAVDQSPIGRTPRSNPATYTNVFTDIRELFAQLPEARMRAWKAGRFSFNAKGGRCEECSGNGYKTLRMHFMPDVYVSCEACGGQRYNKETLEVRFKGKTIADVLNMTVNQAVEFFESQPAILRKIKTIQEVGLGYVKLGQSSTTLSGGESQRMKLATELSRPATGRTLYILDEPTTGLHFEDIRVLMRVLRELVNRGNTVVIIEHSPDVIRACDYIIDMGPEGGRRGGQLVAAGTLDEIRQNPLSLTGKYI